MPIGEYEQVHGWNKNFRDTDDNLLEPRFHSFEWHATGNRPDIFHNIAVGGNYTPPIALDHQGHVVPQNLLGKVLDPIATNAYAQRPRPADIATLNTFLTTNYSRLGFGAVTNYINSVLIPGGAKEVLFVDSEATDDEAWLGGYFSVIMWNPVNICRAPIDARRGQTPGETVDQEVIKYLLTMSVLPSGELKTAFESMQSGSPSVPDIERFIAACNQSLDTLQAFPNGYYQFPWSDHPDKKGVLIPI